MLIAPSFAILTMGSGDYLGSTVRDLTLANALHRRGHKVVVYWMLECNEELADAGIGHRMLCHGTRYHFQRPSEFLDRVVGGALFLLPKRLRVRAIQRRGGYVERLLSNMLRSLFAGPEPDPALARRLRGHIAEDGVTHLLAGFGTLGPLAMAAQGKDAQFDYALTFQGDEEFAALATRIGLGEPFRAGVRQAMTRSAWRAIAVSEDYAQRLVEEIGVSPARLQVVYNGVELPGPGARPDFAMIKAAFPALRQDTPIVLYLGRQESEKGIDLLLYAARLLARRGQAAPPMQLVICGATAKGQGYRDVLTDLGRHLGLAVHHAGTVAPELRGALYAHSHCVVYPSVNREPFGLVVAEAMSHGTPVLVPDYGGVAEVIHDQGRSGGLSFRTWDSGDLARQLGRLLEDRALHTELAANARVVASRFSVDRMADGVLEHMGMRPQPYRAAAGGAGRRA
ncbi:glycosyltransferase family 4 protein [Pseudoduganella namucuonensis]|uniref:Glycosyltransferase involved in cell wall bisynthesis n=1 Tax=Pseudoduganella namucuonensis TaxID=1035707 RepID=A0A1I7GXD5_9BURK|nr:glycosyltransferase family 4 protein [Pseudoduganella namucuonensis]SFU53083.1 Glycosyltransferase involved in cell wall bisynthesis [Pseudoduganella namucuonensis]